MKTPTPLAINAYHFIPLSLLALAFAESASAREQPLPNILWISSEDHGPHLGAYGDSYATTPNLDRFAEQSLLYRKATSNAPVCAPARTTIISGVFPPSLGAHHMRSKTPSPPWLKFFPRYLQEVGYYTTNNSKEDYNLVTDQKGWHESSPQAHWKNRPEKAPFFAVFNFVGTHESQLRNQNDHPLHDPATVPLPPYHPDTAETRREWAQYYDRLTLLDTFVQERLDELEDAGLSSNTIVMFWGDHGSGMPRSKRYPGWSGLHVPLIVRVPEAFNRLAPAEYQAGGQSDRLVSFVDFAPTMLSIADIEAPAYHQGRAFMGLHAKQGQEYSFGFSGRMDERPDSCRSIMDGRYVYIRNQKAHLAHGQYLWYQQQTATTRIWYQLFKDGKLNDIQAAFWQARPREQLFDLIADPHEVRDLARDPVMEAIRRRMSDALDDHLLATRDLGFIPEPMLRAVARDGQSPAEAFAHYFENGNDPIQAAWAELEPGTKDPQVFSAYSPEKRYWQLIRLLEIGNSAYDSHRDTVELALDDREGIVAVAAAEYLALHAQDEATKSRAQSTLLQYARFPENEIILSIHSLNALDRMREAGTALPSAAHSLPLDHPDIPPWAESYRKAIVDRF